MVTAVAQFLKSTWSDVDDVCYRVYMAQKCLNLNEYYFIQAIQHECCSAEEKEALATTRRKTFISQYALLLKADELVEYYAQRKEFPRICIVDELILTGHDFCSLMYRMLDVIFDAWQRRYGEIGQEEYWIIREAFVKSVTYKAYARDTEAPLVDRSLPFIGKPVKLRESDWRKYTADVVELLNESEEVQNTSFIPTFWLPKARYESVFHPSNPDLFGWHSRRWTYGEIQADIWQKSIVGAQNDVRFHLAFVCRETGRGDAVRVTPYAFLGKLSDASLGDLFADIAAALRQHQSACLNTLADICAIPYRAAMNSKLRFLYTLICILELLELTRLQIETLKHDLEKTAQNFGTIEKIYPALQELCGENSQALRGQLRDLIHKAMWGASAIGEDTADCGCGHDPSDCLKSAEDYFIQVDYQERRQTKLRRDEDRTFISSSNFFYAGSCLSHYFKQLSKSFDLEEKAAALTLLAQGNVVSLTISAQGDDIIYAKVGEATAGAARYSDLSIPSMSPYIPALIVLETVCRKLNLTMKYWAARFGAFLEQKGAPKGLERRFRIFVENAYDSGSFMEGYRYVKRNEGDEGEEQNVLYRKQVYYQEQVVVFFRES